MIQKTAFATAILGTAILLILSYYLEPKLINISDINEKMLEQEVIVQGSLVNLRQTGDTLILRINDSTGEIDAVVYNHKSALNKGMLLEVKGKIQEYYNKLEISADRIKIIR